MKRKRSSKPYMASDNNEVSEQMYKQILEADERALWVIYNSLASCVPFSFCSYRFPIFPPFNYFNK